GWAEGAPYDRIVITAGAPHLPKACREQLVDGGRIVIPIGDRNMQELWTIDRIGRSWFENRYSQCRFVPLVGADAWPSGEAT
ncbi:MAG: protein-L-isoaspartate O-methyltransferase, partial [Planctomycetes bacterium]|nr:protein-L-isoaspartate O-methyltransferase [Planctomycetota bacterium]